MRYQKTMNHLFKLNMARIIDENILRTSSTDTSAPKSATDVASATVFSSHRADTRDGRGRPFVHRRIYRHYPEQLAQINRNAVGWPALRAGRVAKIINVRLQLFQGIVSW